ncbi:MAG: energy transducer TonB family protein [Brevinema sp.]
MRQFFSSNQKKHAQYLVLFIWLSLTLHLYVFWALNLFTKLFLEKSSQINNPRQQILQNIILETKIETLDNSPEAAISDKNNRNQSPIQDLSKPEDYNVANPNMAQAQGQGGEISYISQEEVQRDKKQHEQNQQSDVAIQIHNTSQQKASEGGGETAPTLVDIKKKQVINLYNTGTASLATKSKGYAEYFLKMQKKIEKYHKEFFPIYQYYQGLLKDGEVVVEYMLNQYGDIINADVIASYGSDTVDNASLNSIVYARNFGALPKDFEGEESITIRFHFIYLSR